jgi:hypothetical protein
MAEQDRKGKLCRIRMKKPLAGCSSVACGCKEIEYAINYSWCASSGGLPWSRFFFVASLLYGTLPPYVLRHEVRAPVLSPAHIFIKEARSITHAGDSRSNHDVGQCRFRDLRQRGKNGSSCWYVLSYPPPYRALSFLTKRTQQTVTPHRSEMTRSLLFCKRLEWKMVMMPQMRKRHGTI